MQKNGGWSCCAIMDASRLFPSTGWMRCRWLIRPTGRSLDYCSPAWFALNDLSCESTLQWWYSLRCWSLIKLAVLGVLRDFFTFAQFASLVCEVDPKFYGCKMELGSLQVGNSPPIGSSVISLLKVCQQSITQVRMDWRHWRDRERERETDWDRWQSMMSLQRFISDTCSNADHIRV